MTNHLSPAALDDLIESTWDECEAARRTLAERRSVLGCPSLSRAERAVASALVDCAALHVETVDASLRVLHAARSTVAAFTSPPPEALS